MKNSEIIQDLAELDEDDQGSIPRSYKNNTNYLHLDPAKYDEDNADETEEYLNNLMRRKPLLSSASIKEFKGMDDGEEGNKIVYKLEEDFANQVGQEMTRKPQLLDSQKQLDKNQAKRGSWWCGNKKTQQKPIVQEDSQEEDEIVEKKQPSWCSKVLCRSNKKSQNKEL
jgi:hypothetical protein